MSRYFSVIFTLSALLLLSACTGQQKLSQQEVALDFWSAMAAKDFDKAKNFSTKGSMEGITPNNDDSIEKINIKQATVKNGLNVVPTTVLAIENGAEKTHSFDTVMIEENGQWKVDFEKTMTSMMGFSMQDMMEGMGKAMGEAMKGVGEAVGKGLSGGQ